MTDYNNMKPADLQRKSAPKPADPELTRAAAMRMQRDRYKGMSSGEMCRAMDTAELERNARKGGMAAIAEEAYRAGNIVQPCPDLDLGV